MHEVRGRLLLRLLFICTRNDIPSLWQTVYVCVCVLEIRTQLVIWYRLITESSGRLVFVTLTVLHCRQNTHRVSYPRQRRGSLLWLRVRLSVCPQQVGVVSKPLKISRWFLAQRFPSTYLTLCYKEIRVFPKIRVIPLWNSIPSSAPVKFTPTVVSIVNFSSTGDRRQVFLHRASNCCELARAVIRINNTDVC